MVRQDVVALESLRENTHGSQPEFCMSGTRRAVEERHSSWVPVSQAPCQPCRSWNALHRGVLWMTYKLDGNLLAVEQVHSLKDDTKRALSNLLPYPVVDAHYVRR